MPPKKNWKLSPSFAEASAGKSAQGEFPRPSTSSGQNVVDTEERSTFGLIQEYCTKCLVLILEPGII
ncbi:MAG: hypothetical protein A3I89_00490 [Candidatus Harrisonbacteria bacterium RIFCSPLOWO2_02_FULL_41_11]|nr:MAG: hypothetical protein A3I89_00490 [Candidatus Harrisonbacteria bacterium RIFCSPLOWO2_02_FULL_41_11]